MYPTMLQITNHQKPIIKYLTFASYLESIDFIDKYCIT